ncbi:ATP-dependent DNA helicase PIF1-like protein [Tanacetum coccineum]
MKELLRSRGCSLRNWPEMPYPDSRYIIEFGNRLIYDETDFNPVELQTEYERLYASLTTEQKGAYDTIMNSVETGTGNVYFVYGYEGTGKTFLWKTLAAGIRRRGDIVLNVASISIASLLMSGGRTAHSRFHIPINIDETSTCSISAQSDLGALLKNVLPVIPKGSRQDIVSASLKQSYLWDHCKILKVGDGELGEENDGKVEIDVPEEILIDQADDPVAAIVDFTYPNILDNIHDPSYFKEKAVLAPTNEVVNNINEHLLDKFPGEEMVYLSCDSVDKTKRHDAIDKSIFSSEFINGLKFSGVPNHRLALKCANHKRNALWKEGYHTEVENYSD